MTVDPSITHLPKEGSKPLRSGSSAPGAPPQRSIRAAVGVAAAFALVTTALVATTASAEDAPAADVSPLAGAEITVDLSTSAEVSGQSLSIHRGASPQRAIGSIGPVNASSLSNAVAHSGPEAHGITVTEATGQTTSEADSEIGNEPESEPESEPEGEQASASMPEGVAAEEDADVAAEPTPEEPAAEATADEAIGDQSVADDAGTEEAMAEDAAAETTADEATTEQTVVDEPAAVTAEDVTEQTAPETETSVEVPASTGPPDIIFPVVGPMSYVDTWGACRGVGCSRSHKGVDIFTHRLTPLVAAADGVITGARRSSMSISGNTVILTGDDGWRYLYIHLNNDTPGTDDGANPQGWIIPNRLRVGDRVKAGDVIGYIGDSGNAETTPVHVHFEIHEPGVGAINPTPIVAEAEEAGRVVSVASLSSTAAGRAEYAPDVVAWYQALLKRDPTDSELFAWTDRFDIGFANNNDLIADLTMDRARRDPAGAIVRSFQVVLDRLPTLNELRLWEEAYRNGTSLEDVAKTLIDSAPFEDRNGTLSDEAFVGVVYQNAVDTGPSERRLGDWMTELGEGGTRASVAAYLADSYTVKNSTWHGLEVVQAYRAGLDRMPTVEEYDLWVAHLDDGGLIPDVVEGIRGID